MARSFLIAGLTIALAACGKGDAQNDAKRAAPLVKVEAVAPARFVERIDAVGTARANEQVTLAAPVTERIIRLNFEDGGYVSKGQTVAVLAQGQENAQLNEAQARSRQATQQLQRVEELRRRGFATRSNLDEQVALAGQAHAQAQEARASIGDRVITAPFGGWVSLRTISPGAVVSAGTEIATISDLSRIKLDFTVPETVLAAISPGLAIDARSAAYPDQPFRGRIDTIDPVIDPSTRAVTVRAILPNPDRKLKPGMLLTVAVERAPRTNLSVPELAVVGEGDNRYVYTLQDDGSVKRVRVMTGMRSAGRIEILEGLRARQRVVTDGVVKLADGMKVRLAGAAPGGAGR